MAKPILEIEAGKFILALASELKNIPEFKTPEWALYVKTSSSKARPPQEEWWHIRAASILRQIYIRNIVGVSRLRSKYGSKKNRGSKPSKSIKGAGKHIRIILQQAEKAGLVEKVKGKKSGRKLTEKGRSLLNQIADKIK